MRIAELARADLERHLAGAGLGLLCGPFRIHLRADAPAVAESLAGLYGDCRVAFDPAVPDCTLAVMRAKGPRRWVRPQVELHLEGANPFLPLARHLAPPLLEWGINFSIATNAHQYLMLHAAVVERDGRAVVLPAFSGSGKSTLCAALAARGWRLLSDEFALVRPADGRIVPFPRPIALKNDAIGIIAAFAPGARMSPGFTGTPKGTIAYVAPGAEAIARADEAATPTVVVSPRYVASATAQLVPKARSQAFMDVLANAMNYRLLGEAGFETLAALIAGSDCYDFTYGDLDDAVGVFAGL